MNIMSQGVKSMLLAAICAVCMCSCAKSEKTQHNEANNRYIASWISVNHPDAVKTALGDYILEDKEGSGSEYSGSNYVLVRYTVTDLDGNISSTTDAKTAQQVGTYDPSYYYGTMTWKTGEYVLPAGVEDILSGMKEGGKRKALVPSWLFTTKRYANPSDYYNKKDDDSDSYSNAIYTIELVGWTDDVRLPQVDSMEIYAAKYLDGVDSLSYGFYYKQTKAPEDTAAFSKDTTIYINYTGRLLNRQVFDTTDPDTAKMYNIYSSSKTYAPVKITWGESESDITMTASESSSSSSLISGFQKTLWQMRKYEQGIGMFMSEYGYKGSGSGSQIPGYVPLVFEISIVDKPEE